MADKPNRGAKVALSSTAQASPIVECWWASWSTNWDFCFRSSMRFNSAWKALVEAVSIALFHPCNSSSSRRSSAPPRFDLVFWPQPLPEPGAALSHSTAATDRLRPRPRGQEELDWQQRICCKRTGKNPCRGRSADLPDRRSSAQVWAVRPPGLSSGKEQTWTSTRKLRKTSDAFKFLLKRQNADGSIFLSKCLCHQTREP